MPRSTHAKARPSRRRTDAGAAAVEAALKAAFPTAVVEAYRYNPASIRVRVIDAAFERKSRVQRHRRVSPALATLPADVERDIVVLLLLTPAEHEAGTSLMDAEFDDPLPWRL